VFRRVLFELAFCAAFACWHFRMTVWDSMSEQTQAMPEEVVIETKALSRRFGAFTAVDEVSFTVSRGEIFGLIGPNGAGKSTLIKMLTTLLPPTSGSALVAGYDIVRDAAEVRRHIAYVPQLLSADGSLTGYENMLLSARLYGVPRSERAARIDGSLTRMGLKDAAHRLAGSYSGGMIRRLEIAQSLLHRPTVLFLDEPTVGLDPAARETVWERVLELRDRYRRTMIVTSHHMDEINEFCDRIALINHGRIATIGSPAQLKARLGPNATLDDVFMTLTEGDIQGGATGSYSEVRRARRAAREHG
jgi:ABC-2 type transport system ATP-binding protein